MTLHPSIQALMKAHADPWGSARSATDAGHPTVCVSSPSVPIELVRAAGLIPVVVRGDVCVTPAADRCVEAGVFSQRIRCLVDAALTGHLRAHAQVVVPRTSDQDYKCFLYLREFERTNPHVSLPPVRLLDILHTDAPYVRAYTCDRLRAWLADLDTLTGRRTTDADIHDAIVAANTARAAARRLVDLRRDAPCVLGADVFPLLGAYWTLAPQVYAELAHAAADALSAEPPVKRPRVLLAGTPVETPRVHRELEALGAVVVGEISPWGNGVVGEDVAITGDPVDSLFHYYRGSVLAARLPVHEALDSFAHALDGGVDGVVFVSSPADDVYGWDYPRQRRLLDERQVPHVRLEVDECEPWRSSDSVIVAAFVRETAERREAHARG